MAKSSFKFWVRDIVLTILISRFSGIRKTQHDKQGPAGPLEAWLKFEHTMTQMYSGKYNADVYISAL
jgi:hypothetical protein